MRIVYLIRHGKTPLSDGRSRCVGQLDVPLSPEGEKQGRAIGEFLAGVPRLHCAVSPLLRCRQTAAAAGILKPIVYKDLAEVSTGDWDGLPFDEIRRRWPEEYRLRGRDIFGTAPPGGESLSDCRDRAAAAFSRFRSEKPVGNLGVIAHSGVNRMLISALTGMDAVQALRLRQNWGMVTLLLLHEKQAYLGPTAAPGDLPEQIPNERQCYALLSEYGTPEHVVAHCLAVADVAEELCVRLKQRGSPVHTELARAAAMLHDIARVQPHHAVAGARWLLERGYGQVAAIVGDHMQLPEMEETYPTEKSVVFLADKLVCGVERVTLEQRYFSACAQEKRPYRQARRVSEILYGA